MFLSRYCFSAVYNMKIMTTAFSRTRILLTNFLQEILTSWVFLVSSECCLSCDFSSLLLSLLCFIAVAFLSSINFFVLFWFFSLSRLKWKEIHIQKIVLYFLYCNLKKKMLLKLFIHFTTFEKLRVEVAYKFY